MKDKRKEWVMNEILKYSDKHDEISLIYSEFEDTINLYEFFENLNDLIMNSNIIVINKKDKEKIYKVNHDNLDKSIIIK